MVLFFLALQIYLPIWGPQTTSESRLVCDYRPIVNYNHVKYEQQMFSFNTVARTKLYEHGVAALGLIRLQCHMLALLDCQLFLNHNLLCVLIRPHEANMNMRCNR
jgi:hypothetical protein